MTKCRMQAKYGIDEIDFPQTDTWQKILLDPNACELYTLYKKILYFKKISFECWIYRKYPSPTSAFSCHNLVHCDAAYLDSALKLNVF